MREMSELLGAWNSFYAMMGSAAAALTGLMFVVITLVSDQRSASEEGVGTFSTPTVLHVCGALLISGLMAVPFRSLVPIAILLGLTGAAGLFFVVRVALRTSSNTSYRPDLEDWVWHVVLPSFAYAALIAGAIALTAFPAQALFAPAFAAMLLIFIGIHNAWDVVTFLAMGKADANASAGEGNESNAVRPELRERSR